MKTIWIGTRKGLVRFERTDGGWAYAGISHDGVPVTYAFQDPRSGKIYAAEDHGHWGVKLSRSDDGGDTFSQLEPPVYPEGEVQYNPWGGPDASSPAKLSYLWVMAPGGDDQPGTVWFGTIPGGLFRSDDHGETMHLVRGLWDHPSRNKWMGGGKDSPGIHSVVVDPRDSDHLYVAISCAGVLESNDAGQTWTLRNNGVTADFLPDKNPEVGQDPHLLACCPTAPDVMWQQNHCGIWRSVDGGQTWIAVHGEQGPARFGFPIAVHADNPDTAWVIPAISDEKRMPIDGRVMVCRTDDGGQTWREQTQGLPSQGAFDLVYRHSFDIDGDTLVFGSTTGNLFLSDDGGDTWSVLSHHLPPIYSVRFGA